MKSAANLARSNPGDRPVEDNMYGQSSTVQSGDFSSEEEHGLVRPEPERPDQPGSGYPVPESIAVENEPDVPIPSSIRFEKKGDGGNLLAVTIEPSNDFPLGIPQRSIQSWIRQQGCESWQQDENAISRFARQARRLDETREYTLAERKDCFIEVKISPDRLNAWITVSQGFGGIPFTEELLAGALETNHVCHGIKEEVLQKIREDGYCEKVLIAEGEPPVEGEKAKFVPLVEESEHKGAPQEREDGTVDYKDLGLYVTISEGTPILRHIPPTAGAPGKGIDGKPIPAPVFRDRVLIPSVGTAISPDDPDVVIAIRSGKPFYDDNSVRVDPTLEVNKVDPSTGNVIFDGNIIVWGPVEAGYTVQAGRDLTILDTVEGADLTAGKDITLVTGIYGRGKSRIRLKGDLTARFLNDCTIECGGDIEVTDLMSHCFVECEGAVRLGNLGGKGQIIGGDVHVLRKVQARIIGSVSEITTRIAVGPSQEFISKIKNLKKEIAQIKQNPEIVDATAHSQSVSEYDDRGSDPDGASSEHSASIRKLKNLEGEEKELQEKMDSSLKGIIKAEEVYRGAILSVGPERQIIDDLTADFSLYYHVDKTT